jgi:hypothetical protein
MSLLRRYRTFLAILMMATFAQAEPASAADITVNGRVTCSDGQPVVGIWTDVGSGTDKWATRFTMKQDPATSLYTVAVGTNPGSVKLVVGCGGSAQKWITSNRTPARTISKSVTLNASCTPKAPDGTCVWTAPSAEWAPVSGKVVVGCGELSTQRDCPVSGKPYHPYPALDLQVRNQPVYAAGPGKVIDRRTTDSDARGKFVAIEHPDGKVSRYLHMSSVEVAMGANVVARQRIGVSGNTGGVAAHLHYDEQKPYGTRASLGPMYGWGAPQKGTSDRVGFIFPYMWGPRTWADTAAYKYSLYVGVNP